MENKAIAKHFKLLAQLMELHEDNPFRTKAVASAGFQVDKYPYGLYLQWKDGQTQWEGLSSSTTSKVLELFETGQLASLNSLLEKTPSGVVDLLQLKGLGPKKIAIIWKQLGIESLGELQYACNENRLIEAKGFGLKTQQDIGRAIEFAFNNKGWLLYAKALKAARQIELDLAPWFLTFKHAHTGALRRACEVMTEVEFLLETTIETAIKELSNHSTYLLLPTESQDQLRFEDDQGVRFVFYFSDASRYAYDWWRTTGSSSHLAQLAFLGQPILPATYENEEAIYERIGIAHIAPELREGTNEVEKAKHYTLPTLIEYTDLKGALHNHSTYSDGIHTLEQMLVYSKDTLKLQYFGICDHSRTAVYANGLSEDRIRKQWEEIDLLNTKYAPFKIFKGIESDILSDGSLDYSDDFLVGFDFVVASIHSNLKMDEEKATNRLIKAIENPYTTILGHPTGRLLLSREGYPIDYQKVIDACAENGVVIEINANPLRLDLDWRWHQYALEKGVLLSINPDAHRMEGLLDMHYGLLAARKGGVEAHHCLNAKSIEEITTFFNARKNRINGSA